MNSSPVNQTLLHDTAVDVAVCSQHISPSPGSSWNHKPKSPNRQTAKMIVSIWTLEGETYFALSFTSSSPAKIPSSQSHIVSRCAPGSSSSSGSGSSPTSNTPPFSRSTSSYSSTVTSASETPLSAIPFPPPGAPAKCLKASAPTVLQKMTRMKDAMLDAMKIPVFAMWRDESLTFPNRAARRLFDSTPDSTSEDGYDFLSRFKAYTADFERELEPDEIPIVKLCRTQKGFSNWEIGIVESKTGKPSNYNVMGEGIFDDKSGEFLGGLILMKDVTEYTERLAKQSEENEQQFQLICDTMPQMLWTTRSDGFHDWFSKRWYDYTGLTQKESMGMGWRLPFHPDDMPQTGKRWTQSLATGNEYTTEYRCRSHDGQWRWFLGRALPLRDHKTGEIVKWFGKVSFKGKIMYSGNLTATGTCTDIDELVQARTTARRMREQLLNVIEHAEVTVWALDRQRKLTFFEGKAMWDTEPSEISPNQ